MAATAEAPQMSSRPKSLPSAGIAALCSQVQTNKLSAGAALLPFFQVLNAKTEFPKLGKILSVYIYQDNAFYTKYDFTYKLI